MHAAGVAGGARADSLAREFPRARFILAHAGVSDLAWIWQRVADHPNVLFDTAWYSAADLRALFALVPPGQVLYATDVPFGAPMQGMILAFRAALQAGLTGEQIAVVAGGQLERLVAGEELIDAGPPPGVEALRSDPLLDRVNHYLVSAFGSLLAGGSSAELADLARLACDVGERAPQAPICRSIVALLDLESELASGETLAERLPHIHLFVVAAMLAATPDVPVD